MAICKWRYEPKFGMGYHGECRRGSLLCCMGDEREGWGGWMTKKMNVIRVPIATSTMSATFCFSYRQLYSYRRKEGENDLQGGLVFTLLNLYDLSQFFCNLSTFYTLQQDAEAIPSRWVIRSASVQQPVSHHLPPTICCISPTFLLPRLQFIRGNVNLRAKILPLRTDHVYNTKHFLTPTIVLPLDQVKRLERQTETYRNMSILRWGRGQT